MKLGTYAIEQDYSQYVSRASEMIFAVVGTATKGPINTPTVCTSVADFIRKFGNLCTDCLGLYAGQYFLNQANKIYYVRAASDTAKKSSAKIAGKTAGDVLVEDAIVVQAKTEGTHADGYVVTISDVVTSAEDTKFKMTIKNTKSVVLEEFNGISFKSLTLNVGDETTIVPSAITSEYIELVSVSGTADKVTSGDYTFSGGDNGISGITSAEYIKAGETLADDNIDMNLFAVPGVSDSTVIVDMLALAEQRQDTLYLVDPPNHLDKSGVEAWHNDTETHTRFNSSYGALYWSWQRIYDSVNRVYIDVPPSVVVAPTIAKSVQMSEIWYAPAGLQRGIVSGVLAPVVAPTSTDRDDLYTGDNNVNCIVTDPQVGICIFGQKTLYRQDTALNRVNVRMLLNYLKRVVVAACRSLTFEPNDHVTWNSFEGRVEPILRSIQNHRGIYEYSIVHGDAIVTDNDIDNYRMPCMILIRPTKSAEDIPIYFTLTTTGADFNDVLEANGIVLN